MLALVAVHVLGVLVSSRLHHENLVRSMVTGHKSGRPEDAIRSAWRSVAALMVVAVLGFWSWQWTQAPDPGLVSAQPAAQPATQDMASARHGRRHGRQHGDD